MHEPLIPEPLILEALIPETLPSGVTHGAFDFAELERLGLQPDAVIDFSVNSNPFGPSPQVRQALQNTPLDRYPDRAALGLRRALAQRLGLTPESLLVGNGSAELIWLAAFCTLKAGSRVLILGPTFGEYERCARLMGAEIQMVNASPEEHFAPPLAAFEHQMKTCQPHLACICNPNNPTGQWIEPQRLFDWAQRYPATLFMVDEAYQQFIPEGSLLSTGLLPNLLVQRSMTKDYALAGLRLGYAAGTPSLIHALAQAQISWSVNSLALAAGLAALQDEAYAAHCWAELARESGQFQGALHALGWATVPSRLHYFLMYARDGRELRQSLLRQGVLVRDCASFGLPAYVRIATRLPAQNQVLLHALPPAP